MSGANEVVWTRKGGPVHVPLGGGITWCGLPTQGTLCAPHYTKELIGLRMCWNCVRSLLAHPGGEQAGDAGWAWQIARAQAERLAAVEAL